MNAGTGHNGGPSLEPGTSWRRHCWGAARSALLPHLPIEVLRGRVKRAKELGLDYTTYASVRAASGHDVVAFLFSTNALRLLPNRLAVPADRAAKLDLLRGCDRIALAVVPLEPQVVRDANAAVLDAAHAAPFALASFAQARDALRAALGKVSGDRVVLVGDLTLERDWCAAGRLAGYLPAERYFAVSL